MKILNRLLTVLLPLMMAMMADSCKKLPWEVLVTDITLNVTAVELSVDETYKLIATVSPSDATNSKVNWQTNNSKVAVVDDSGLITAKSVGEAIISAKTDDGSVKESCKVVVVEKQIPVESVTLSRKTLNLLEGEKETLVVTIKPSDATDREVTWSSDNKAVASVADGVVTAIKEGTAVITVTAHDGGKTATCQVNVSAVPVEVEAVTLDKTTLSMKVGEEAALTATVSPEDATNKEVKWSSSDETVAVVDNGIVKALKGGTAIITVKTVAGAKTASCTVTVENPEPENPEPENPDPENPEPENPEPEIIAVTSVTLDKASAELTEGDELTLVATVNPDNATDKSVTWSSSDASVASVVNGKVTALKAGTATITVTTTDGSKTATCKVTVKAKEQQPENPEPENPEPENPEPEIIAVTSVTLDKTSAELIEGDELTLVATVNPDNATDKSVTWSSSDASVASVADGKVTALKAGTATITVTTTDGSKTATCKVTVKAKVIAVTSVTLDKASAELTEGDELTLVATVNPDNATDKSVTWSSSDASVASVVNGKVTALKAGTATITVTTTDGSKTATCKVTVKAKVIAVTSVTLDKASAELTEGDELTLTATVNPDNATDKSVTWSSSDASVASVVNGKVTALKAGTATITVTTTDGSKTAACKVTVKAKYVAVESVTLDKTSVQLIEGHGITLTATVNPAEATDKSVTWTSSDESVVTVTDGKLIAKAIGTATITVTTNDGNKTATCEVTVTEQPLVTLEMSSTELYEGEEITLAATVSIAGTSLIWSTDDATVATVTDGKVKAVKAGTAVITVKTADGGSSATCEITVKKVDGSVDRVTLDKSSAILKIGDTLTLTAIITPTGATNKNVTWKSSDATVATVDAGVVKALKVGTATIAVTTEDGGKTAFCKVKVVTNEGNEGVGENQGNWE